jgi:hypothetical protein
LSNFATEVYGVYNEKVIVHFVNEFQTTFAMDVLRKYVPNSGSSAVTASSRTRSMGRVSLMDLLRCAFSLCVFWITFTVTGADKVSVVRFEGKLTNSTCTG